MVQSFLHCHFQIDPIDIQLPGVPVDLMRYMYMHINVMPIKLVKKIPDLNPVGVRTKGQPKNGWRDKLINDLKKLKLRNWS